MVETVKALTPTVSVRAACKVVGLPRATYYRSQRAKKEQQQKRKKRAPNTRRLSNEEREEILAVLYSERFCDLSPRQIYATLLDEGVYLCHWRMMYIILSYYRGIRERRNQLMHPPYKKPELLATGPNQVWSWDMTKLRGPTKGSSYTLYVMIDVFSRYVVGWMVAPFESGDLAKGFVQDCCEQQEIGPNQLIIHTDRGGPMTSSPYLQTLAEMGIRWSHSRPYRSNDNAYSEAQFKTMKYHPTFPYRFGSIEDARVWVGTFMHHYNYVHYHTELALMRPYTVHTGRSREVRDKRQRVIDEAYARRPDRFFRGKPTIHMPPSKAWINPPNKPWSRGLEGTENGAAAPDSESTSLSP